MVVIFYHQEVWIIHSWVIHANTGPIICQILVGGGGGVIDGDVGGGVGPIKTHFSSQKDNFFIDSKDGGF